MSDETATTPTPPSRSKEEHNLLIRVLLAIRSSFLLFVATTGVVLMVIGATVLGGQGVLSAMFAIWGLSAIIYAAGGVVFMRLIGYR